MTMSEKTKELSKATDAEKFDSIKAMIVQLAHKNFRTHGGDLDDIIQEGMLIAWETIQKGMWKPESGALTTYMHYRVALKLLNYQKRRFRIGGLSHGHVTLNPHVVEGSDLSALTSVDLIDQMSPDATVVVDHITRSRARTWGGVNPNAIASATGLTAEQTNDALVEILDVVYPNQWPNVTENETKIERKS